MFKNNHLKHYWFGFDLKNYSNDSFIASMLGYGVTAYSTEDAKDLLMKEIFNNMELPTLISLKENIKVSDIEANHVAPNIGLFIEKGVWFPNMNMR